MFLCYSFDQVYPKSEIAESYDNSVFCFRRHPYCFPPWLHQFIVPPTAYEGFILSTSCPTFAGVLVDFLLIVVLTGVK